VGDAARHTRLTRAFLRSVIHQGYALVEFETRKEAEAAITALNGSELLTKTIAVDWAFSRAPAKRGGGGGRR
jgi:RNA recognition motif-containing protein